MFTSDVVDVSAVPGSPTNVVASDVFSTSAVISWDAPKNDGGSPIIGYVVDRNTGNSDRWIRVTRNPVADTKLPVDNLMEETIYQYRVSAVNKKGESAPSEPCEPFTAKNPFGECQEHLSCLLFSSASLSYHRVML